MKLVEQINDVNDSLSRIGCAELQIGGEYMDSLFVQFAPYVICHDDLGLVVKEMGYGQLASCAEKDIL